MGQALQIDPTGLTGPDAGRAARLLKEARAAALSGRRSRLVPRPVIGESWERVIERGVDPDHDHRAGLLSLEELEERRRRSPLAEVLPVLREGLLSVADAAQHIMAVCDAEGRVLWREGSAAVLRVADGMGLEVGSDWRETVVGTNGLGTPLVVRRPVQVFSAEHFVRTLHPLTCAGAPITDPRDGRLLGVVDVSGPLDSMHPVMLALVGSVAQLAEARLRERHAVALDRLRAVAAPLLARVGGRALAVDRHGWTAAVAGMAPVDRLALPASFGVGRSRLAALGMCLVEPLPGGWLVRVEDGRERTGTTRVVLDLRGPRCWCVTVSGGAGEWTHELSPRHAELLYLLAAHRGGRSAAQLAQDVFGDAARTVTVRAEVSRIRRYLHCLLEHRPYRFREGTEVGLLLPDRPADLLPHSTAPAVRRARVGGG
ncbi:GAF domain-containing protein [Streptomyces sulfonofaciens]|uniref:GAF domain-containing protein n=1 Tax=Streptomyces sulfonofaciens TaxID=68272 RepID=UPI001E4C0801|nr:helix-turn-helix domain-containing protein [Streptomyces sulfonofaciens]